MKVQLPSETSGITFDFGQPDANGEFTSLDASLQHTDITPTPYNKAVGAVKVIPTTSRTNKGVQRSHLTVRVPLPLVASAALCGCGDSGKRSPSGFAQMSVDLTLPNAEGVLADVTQELDANGQPTTVRAANLLAANMARNVLLGLLLHNAGTPTFMELGFTLNDMTNSAIRAVSNIAKDPLYRGVSGVAPVDPACDYTPKAATS